VTLQSTRRNSFVQLSVITEVMLRYHFFDFDTISERYGRNIATSVSVFSK